MNLGLRRFTRLFVLQLWPWYLSGALFLAITNIITLEIPQLAKEIINALEKTQLPQDSSLAHLGLAIIVLGSTQIIVRSLSRILIFWPGRKLEASSKSYLFAKVQTLPQTFYDRFGMGDLISRLSNDLGQLRVFFAFGILQVLNLVFISVFTLYRMFSVHAQLTAIALTPILLMLVTARFVMPKLSLFTKKNQEAIGTLTNKVTESLSHIHVIQANAAEQSFLQAMEKENEKVFQTDMKVLVLRTLFFPLITSLTALSQIIVLFLGGSLVVKGELSVGDILAFNIYLSYLAFPLTSIGIVIAIYQRSKTALERLDPIFVEDSEAPSSSAVQSATDQAPLLACHNLSFRYPGAAQESLSGIQFNMKAGETIGLCGPMGAGKSTLFQLITRLYDPPTQSIQLQGQDITSFHPDQLRLKVGLALQKVHLFSASLEENLCFGLEPRPSQAQLETACRDAQMLDEIKKFPDGWKTEIGEKGIRLSGGQKQRLALARLFLRKTDLTLLDDVFSAVDTITEARLIEVLRNQQQSMIIASHRHSILKHCDRVIYLRDGRLIDQGPFRELCLKYPELQEEKEEPALAN